MNDTKMINIPKALLWTSSYFLVMLLAAFLDIVIWRKVLPEFAPLVNIVVLSLMSGIFLYYISKKTQIVLPLRLDIKGIIISILFALLFFLLLDNFLDPIFESIFSASESEYLEMTKSLKADPIISVIRVVLLAPIVEETLMRGFILTGLRNRYNTRTALLVSTLLFALLHFNAVQTLSAVISGFILGCIYIKTNNLTTSIMTHALYNMISLMVVFDIF